MTKPRSVGSHPITRDMPLPGHYPVLTLQLNLTRYHPAGTLRWTLIVREPTDQIEISRTVQETTEDTEGQLAALQNALFLAYTEMLWLQTGMRDS